MRIDILPLIHFSFYKPYVKQTIKYYNLISGTIIRHDTVLSGRSRISKILYQKAFLVYLQIKQNL